MLEMPVEKETTSPFAVHKYTSPVASRRKGRHENKLNNDANAENDEESIFAQESPSALWVR